MLRLTWPIAVSMLSYSLMTVVDMIFVGRLGPAAIAGMSLAGLASWVGLCFSVGLLRSSKVLVSQATGAGRAAEFGPVIGASLALAAVLGLVTALVGILVGGHLQMFAATPASGLAAQDYFVVRMLGAPVLLVGAAVREALYGLGESQAPMRATLLGNVVNAGLCYPMIYGLELGVAGSAWAANIGLTVELVLLLLAVRAVQGGRWSVRRAMVRQLWALGVPLGLQYTLEVGAFAVLTAMVARLGDVALAAHQIALQINHFSFLPALALSEATSVLVGQAVGARRDDLVMPLARRALVLAVGYMGTCSIVFVLAGTALGQIFTNDPVLVSQAALLLVAAAIFGVLDGANIVVRGALRGAGDVRWPAVVGIVSAWLCTPLLTWFLGFRLGLGVFGGWLGLSAEIGLGAAVLWWRMLRGDWRPLAERLRRDIEATRDSEPIEAPRVANAG